MFENATTVEFQPGQVDEALHILRTDVVPVLKGQKGLVSLCFLPDHAADKIVVISLWVSKAHALAVEAVSAYQKEVKKLDPLLAQQPDYPAYEASTLERAYSQVTAN